MELVSTIEISGEEREIADAVARGQCAANAEGIDGINSNLSQLEYEIYDNSKSQWVIGAYTSTGDANSWSGYHRTVNYTEVTPNTTYTISNSEKGNFSNGICYYDANKNFLSWNFYVENGKTFKTPSNCKYIRFAVQSENIPTSVSIKTFNSEFLTEEVKHQNESLIQQSTEAMDLKMLGWSVPSECPVQNYVDSNGVYHQKVGRVDLGSLDFELSASVSWGHPYFQHPLPLNDAKIPKSNSDSFNGYCYKYKTTNWNGMGTGDDKSVCIITSGHLRIKDTTYTDATSFKNAMKGVYLYYELTEEKTISVDGNEVTERIKNDLGGLSFSVSGTTLSITDGTNTWTLSN